MEIIGREPGATLVPTVVIKDEDTPSCYSTH